MFAYSWNEADRVLRRPLAQIRLASLHNAWQVGVHCIRCESRSLLPPLYHSQHDVEHFTKENCWGEWGDDAGQIYWERR